MATLTFLNICINIQHATPKYAVISSDEVVELSSSSAHTNRRHIPFETCVGPHFIIIDEVWICEGGELCVNCRVPRGHSHIRSYS